MAKKIRKASLPSSSGWNEFNTFSKLIYPHLNEKLGYPPRKSKFFDEQTWVRKRGDVKGPYDGAFKNQTGVILLVEAKKEDHKLSSKDITQLFDYCLGDSFPVPPPYALLSNGIDYKWFKRLKNSAEEFSYAPCDEIPWSEALKQKGSGLLTEQLTLKQTIRLLKVVREKVFQDLTDQYFPLGYNFSKSKLGPHKDDFEKILYTRKSFVDPTLEKADEETAIRSVLSSISLSLTLKILFIKIITDRKNDPFPERFKADIKKQAKLFPGILKAEPYDALELSDQCAEFISEIMSSASITQALVFEERDNPIGDIWDGLVESEELDLQVKSLGNVYTPSEIVCAMVDRAERTLGAWKGKRILEPSCGSGHFVREIYNRMKSDYLGSTGNGQKVIKAHIEAISNIRAMDIDPFAVQTTQLGMFLELYRIPALWDAIAPNGQFDFGRVVQAADFLDENLSTKLDHFIPDLVIGNPPYGINVTEKVAKHFNVGSNDSYGCFISQGLSLLPDDGKLLLIVSSTFLTNRTHRNLRQQIFLNSKIDSVYTLHRNAFPGRDVFCCIFELTKQLGEMNKREHLYRFMDAWPIHPKQNVYLKALKSWSTGCESNIDNKLLGDYFFPQHLIELRLVTPQPSAVETKMSDGKLGVDINLVQNESIFPIVAGLPSLYFFCTEKPYERKTRYSDFTFPIIGKIKGIEINRTNHWVPIIKLWQVAQVRQGLATADDELFLRKTPGIVPNARRRYIKDVDLRCTIDPKELSKLTTAERESGIKVTDPKRDRYFVPFDKGGEQNTAEGELRSFWSPVDYWIDWSTKAVKTLTERNNWPPGTPKKPRFQNKRYYFTQGIRFSPAGLYSPTFELSFGGVFGHKGSLIVPSTDKITKYLLAVLCSPLVRYFTKCFLQHTVMTEIDVIRQIPIVVPTQLQFEDLTRCVDHIIRKKSAGDYAEDEMKICWQKVFELYRIPEEDQREIKTWFKRRYPHFGKAMTQVES